MVIWYLVFIIAGCVDSTTAAKATRCCESGFYMSLNRTTELVYCKNNVTGERAAPALEDDCEKSALITEQQAHFNVSDEGTIIIWQNWGPEEVSGYCVGEVRGRPIATKEWKLYRALATCLVETIDNSTTMAYCMFVSTVFLYVTAIIYAALPELRDLQGKSVINLCISLGTAFLIMAIEKISLSPKFGSSECLATALSAYFFVIAAFFWMNAISFQIYRNIRRSASPERGYREFSLYFLYAWGMAFALSVLVLVLDKLEGSHIKPGIARTSCWFHTDKELWVYVYSVILIIVVFNMAIFIYLSVTLWRSTFMSDHIRNLKYKVILMLRLFVIMGIPWIFEMVSGSLNTQTITAVIDIVNGLVGVSFFLVLVVLRLRTLKALQKRGYLCCLTACVESIIARLHDHEADAIVHTAITLDDNN